MSRRKPADLQRLILQCRKAVADVHHGKQRSAAAAARLARYELELQDLQRPADPPAEIMAIVSQPYTSILQELVQLEDKLERAIKSIHHFQAFADKAQNDQDRAKRLELVAYWRRRADNAQSRIDEVVLYREKSGLDNLH